jgi:CelD/BcsL family acetyltransferase involved in cellulose biosynthesis
MMFDNLDVSRHWPAHEHTPLAEEVVTSLRELESLQGEWRWLWTRCAGASSVLRPEWLMPWYRRCDPSFSPLRVLTLRSQGRLVGLAPLAVRKERSARVVRLLGEGLPDYLDVLMDPELAPQGVETLLGWLARHGDDWDTCVFEQLREDSALLRTPAPMGWSERIETRAPPAQLAGTYHRRSLWITPAKTQ